MTLFQATPDIQSDAATVHRSHELIEYRKGFRACIHAKGHFSIWA